jgi:hypothetical protein
MCNCHDIFSSTSLTIPFLHFCPQAFQAACEKVGQKTNIRYQVIVLASASQYELNMKLALTLTGRSSYDICVDVINVKL